MAGEVVRECVCCGDNPPPPHDVDFLRVVFGQVYQRGFPPLMAFGPQPAGRYIAPGWTGVTSNMSAYPRDNLGELRAVEYTDGLLAWHKTGQRVKLRSGANGATVAIYWIPETVPGNVVWSNAIPGDAPWVAAPVAGSDPVNTYIVQGFWRNLRNFVAGDLVYRCTPNALETDDDWSYEPFICNEGVVGAGDPATDAHFTSLLTGLGRDADQFPEVNEFWGQIPLTKFFQSFAPGVTVAPGEMIPGPLRALHAHTFADPAEHDAASFEPISLTRPLAPAESRVPAPGGCRVGPLSRSLNMRQRSELTGDAVANGVGEQSFGIQPDSVQQVSYVEISQSFTALDEVFAVPALPAIGGIVATYTRHFDFLGTLYDYSGGSFTANVSNGDPPTFKAGDRYRQVEVYHNFDGSVNHTDERTLVVLIPEITADEPLAFNGIPEFSVEMHRGRLSYPNLPALGGGNFTVVRGIRLRSVTLGAGDNTFTWDLLICPYALISKAPAGNVLANYDKLAKVTLTQRITLSTPDTAAAAVQRMHTEVRESIGTPTLPSAGSFYEIGGPLGFFTGEGFNLQRVLEFFMAGPQTASLRNYYCRILQGCVNINVPPAGLAYNIPDAGEEEAHQVTLRRPCA